MSIPTLRTSGLKQGFSAGGEVWRMGNWLESLPGDSDTLPSLGWDRITALNTLWKKRLWWIKLTILTKLVFVNFEFKKITCCKRLQNNPSIQTLLLARELDGFNWKTCEFLCFCSLISGSETGHFSGHLTLFLGVYTTKLTGHIWVCLPLSGSLSLEVGL